jgi:hypothetical protein
MSSPGTLQTAGREEDKIENLFASGKIRISGDRERYRKAKRIDDASGRYIVFCKNTVP